MLERVISVVGKRLEPIEDIILPKDRQNAMEFVSLVKQVLGNKANLSHFNNLEIYVKLTQDGRKRYFLKEELSEKGKFYTDYYFSGGTRLIYKRLEFGVKATGADEKLSGRIVKDIKSVQSKIQKIINPLGANYGK